MSIGDFNFALLSESEKKYPFYLIGAGLDFHQELDPHDRPDGYPHYQWIQVVKGRGELTVHNKTYIVEENQGIFLFPHTPHEYHTLDSPWIVNWFTFNGFHLKEFLKQLDIKRSDVYSVAHLEIFTSKIRRALDLLKSNNSLKGLETSALVYEFLVTFKKYAYQRDGSSVPFMHSRLKPVLEYIDSHYRNSVNIDAMAGLIGVTPQYLCLLFKGLLKQRPMEYLNNVRITKSKDILLNNPVMKVEEVSKSTGYESSSYFCSTFKKIEGISPGRFRELHLNQRSLQQKRGQ